MTNVFSNAVKYHDANLCANSSTMLDPDYILQFLTIFAQNLTILTKNNKILT